MRSRQQNGKKGVRTEHSQKRKVLAFEFENESRIVPTEDRILFLNWGEKCPSFDEFDFVILQSGSFFIPDAGFGTPTSVYEKIGARKNEMIKREKQISNALGHGKTVCFLLWHTDDVLMSRILQFHGIRHYEPWGGEFRTDVTTKRSEFADFLNRFGAARVGFSEDVDDMICSVGNVNVGFAKYAGKGILLFIPCNVPSFPGHDEIIDLLRVLSESLTSYSYERRFELPYWIDALRFPKEVQVRTEIGEHQKRIEELDTSLREYSDLKTILCLEGDRLDDMVRRFFERIGLQTRKDKGFEEDFWILENGDEQVIVEVKGKSKNLQRQDISKLDEHRAAKEKPDDFPALLVVNSFARAGSLEEKGIDISPAELRKAVQTHVLIVRTLDMFNLFTLMEEGRMDQKTLLDLLKTETGWLKASTDAYEVLRNNK